MLSKMYRDMYRIVRQISRYVWYREVTVSLQPYLQEKPADQDPYCLQELISDFILFSKE